MAVTRQTWARLNLWRILLQLSAVNVGCMAWLGYAIVNHQGNEIWASALFLSLIGLPTLLGLALHFRREPFRSFLFGRSAPEPASEAETDET